MRIALNVLRSPLIVRVLHLAHVEAILLSPRNQSIRWRYRSLFEEYLRIYFNHSDSYSAIQGDADIHQEVIEARRPILAVEAMLTDRRCQAALADYREACSRADRGEMKRIEQNIAAILELGPVDGAERSLDAVG